MTAPPTPNLFWNERPSALGDDYANKTVGGLLAFYEHDNRRLHPDPAALGVALPAKNPNGIRVCQWNINHLSHARRWVPGGQEAAEAVAKVLLETDADVLVLNEYGTTSQEYNTDKGPLRKLHTALEKAGYNIFVAPTEYPTAVATRLPIVDCAGAEPAKTLNLDGVSLRGAVGVTVLVKPGPNEQQSSGSEDKHWLVYGTHLEACDGEYGRHRLRNMTTLLAHIQKEDATEGGNRTRKPDAILIAGDFNQQREKDYTDLEWNSICENKQRRNSPPDDGVATMLNDAGFHCCYDSITAETDLNWKAENPPPSSHWTGTLIDYCYAKPCVPDESTLKVNAIHVSPCSLSDHRLIVTDWVLS